MAKAKEAEHLSFLFTEDGFVVDDRATSEAPSSWTKKFEEDRYAALYDFGFETRPKNTDAAGHFLYDVADAFLNALTNNPDLEVARQDTKVELDAVTLDRLLSSVPFTLGSQYISKEWLNHVFEKLNQVFSRELAAYCGSVQLYLSGKSQQLKVKERIFFHLVEHKDSNYPFAFLATYATKDEKGHVQHVPLQNALIEYKADKEKLLELLACLNKVSEESPIISEFVSLGELFHPLQLTSDEAYQILKDIPKIEEAGIVCRIPNWWRRKSNGMKMAVKVNGKKDSFVGLESILTSRPLITVDGEPLTKREIEMLLKKSEGLALIKGKWVEVNHEKLRSLLAQLDEWGGDISLLDAMRLSMGEGSSDEEDPPAVLQNQWLNQLLTRLRNPQEIRTAAVPKDFKAQLRPYQKTGFTWLDYMAQLNLGACLADDMGLGKTVQVLAFLERMRTRNPLAKALLIVPASLLGNWEKEKEKFAPDMAIHILHGRPARVLAEEVKSTDAFLTVTTYGMASRIEELEEVAWDALILDEAQAIKNPNTKQARQIKKLKGKVRIALTGTPIENDLVNLWSLFDFLNKGLLGNLNEFKKYSSSLDDHPERYAQLKNMIAPFLLRRMKTDKTIISDLPEKLEEVDYVALTKRQAVLYEKVVEDVLRELENAGEDGFRRSGVVLRSLMKFKQICNHPDQFLGQPITNWKESGKFEMMRDLCETIRDNRERVLVFTQFKEITPYLDEYLEEIFGCKGFVIHGSVPVKKRNEIVEAFQSERYYPYIVLSVKAGGTGLNLTNANHVIHFDRWWNPAVENQATDRVFRIGQQKNVMVHKLVCQGTIEEKIDRMIESKKELAENVIGGSSGENWITDLSNAELASLMQLQR